MLLAIATTVAGVVAIGVTLHCYKKKHGLSWNICCYKNDDDDSGEVEQVGMDSLP